VQGVRAYSALHSAVCPRPPRSISAVHSARHSAISRLRPMSVIVESEPRSFIFFSKNFEALAFLEMLFLYAEMKINMRRIKNLLYYIKNFYLDY